MSKKEISWKLDRLAALVRLNEPLTIIADEWAQLATGNDSDLDIPLDPENPNRPRIVFTVLDDQRFVIAYFSDRNTLNIHLDYENPNISKKTDIIGQIERFCKIVNQLSDKYLKDSINEVKLGMEVIDYTKNANDGVKSLQNDFSYFSGIDKDVEDIELRLKSSESISSEIKVNKNIVLSSGKKINIKVDGSHDEISPRDIVSAEIELSVIDTSINEIDYSEHTQILRKKLIGIIEQEF